jgi:hypothetical protein
VDGTLRLTGGRGAFAATLAGGRSFRGRAGMAGTTNGCPYRLRSTSRFAGFEGRDGAKAPQRFAPGYSRPPASRATRAIR